MLIPMIHLSSVPTRTVLVQHVTEHSVCYFWQPQQQHVYLKTKCQSLGRGKKQMQGNIMYCCLVAHATHRGEARRGTGLNGPPSGA